MSKNSSFSVRLLGMVCAVALVVVSLAVPLTFASSAATIPTAENETVTFGFEEAENPVLKNENTAGAVNLTRGDDGIGCCGWSIRPEKSADGNWYLGSNFQSNQTWANLGGYRLNNNDGVYNLDPATTYVVQLKVRVGSAPSSDKGAAAAAVSNIQLGYNFVWDKTLSGQAGNSVNAMKTVVSEVVSVANGAKTFTATDVSGAKTYNVGADWYDLVYSFTTPATMGANSSLGFYGKCHAGVDFEIDNVSVTKMGNTTGMIVAIDSYYGTVKTYSGTIDTTVALPTLTGSESAHIFEGWYTAADGGELADSTFTTGVKTVYSHWDVPITVTFVDALNGNETPVTGKRGETITYPADPTDPADPDTKWFMGWYTTPEATVEFTEANFGLTSKKAYALWKSETAVYTEDFESYTADEITGTFMEGDVKRYKNVYYFGNSMKKVNTEKFSGQYSLCFNWDGDMALDKTNPDTYDAAIRWASTDNVARLDNFTLENKTQYVCTFKYKVVSNTNCDVKVFLNSASLSTIWSSGSNYAAKGGSYIIKSTEADNAWHTGTMTFTTDFSGSGTTMYFCNNVTVKGDDATVYYDDIHFEPVAQPYESAITFVYNNGESNETVVANRGTALPIRTPSNGDCSFLGWFTDESLSVPFTDTVYSRKPVTVYAKWSTPPMTFKNYPYSTSNVLAFGPGTMSLKTDAGYDDNYSVHFHWKGSDPWYQNGEKLKDRAAARDNCVPVAEGLSPNTTYLVTYYYKSDSANVDSSIYFATGANGSIWSNYFPYADSRIILKATDAGKGWIKKSVCFTTGATLGDCLYAVFNVAEKTDSAAIEANFDLVTVAEVTNLVIYHSNLAGLSNEYQIGNIGDPLALPTVSYDNYQFINWTTDAEGTVPFTGTTITAGVTDVYAQWFAMPYISNSITFKNYPYNTTSVLVFGPGTMSIDDNIPGVGYDDDYALHFHWKGDEPWYENDQKFKDRAGSIDNCYPVAKDLLPNTTYLVDYYVNVASMNSEYSIFFALGQEGNIWGGKLQRFEESKVTVGFADAGKGWVKKTACFTTGATPNKVLYAIYNVASKSDDAAIEAEFDCLTLTVCNNLVAFHGNASNVKTQYQIGKPGDAIVFPTPENTRSDFYGWYTDVDCTVPATATKITREEQHFYAKWSEPPETFDNYRFSGSLLTFGYALSIKNQPQVGIDDNYAAHFHWKGDDPWYEGDQKFKDRASSRDNCIQMAKAVEDKTTYLVTLYVKVSSANSAFNINFATDTWGNIWSPADFVKCTSGTISVPASDAGKGWVKKNCVITTNLKSDIGNALYLYLTVDDKSDDAAIEADFDNISYQKMSNAMIFNANADGVLSSYQIAAPGTPIAFPTLSNGKHTFLGWFADEACRVPYTGKVLPEGIVSIYAKWSTLPITFEGYTKTTNYFSIGQEYYFPSTGYDDNICLEFRYDADDIYLSAPKTEKTQYMRARCKSIDNCTYLQTVKNNTCYRISFYYKVLSATCNSSIRFSTGNKGNIWVPGNNRYSSAVEVGRKPTDWIRGEVIINTDIPKEGCDTLFINNWVDNGTPGQKVDILMDNVLIEQIDPPYVFFDGQNDQCPVLTQGDVGDRIEFPSAPTKFGYKFDRWYADKECTVPFENSVYTDGMMLNAYAGYVRAQEVTYDFENYSCLPENIASGTWNIANCEVKEVPNAYSGVQAIVVDKDPTYPLYGGGCFAAVARDSSIYKIDTSKKYLVTFKYYIARKADGTLKVKFMSGAFGNYWYRTGTLSAYYQIKKNTEVGKWLTGSLVFDGSMVKEGQSALFIAFTSGSGGLFYFDDITVTEYVDGETAYLIDNSGCKEIPSSVSGKIGASFESRLPKNPTMANYVFKGYYYIDPSNNAFKELSSMVFEDDVKQLVARFVRIENLQDFETGFDDLYRDYPAYGFMDFDYEIYNAASPGNSMDNVTSGTHCLHRKGTTPFFENAQVLTEELALVEGERYTLSFKVKMGAYKQTNGAIKFASGRSEYYAWTVNGDYYAAVAIADLTDGQWHEVSYTFNSVEAYLVMQTPGYCELFIDDVSLTRAANDSSLSSNVTYTEYVPAERDENGNLIGNNAAAIDVSGIIDASLNAKETNWLFYGLIGGGALLVIGAGVAAFFIIRKVKRRKKTAI